MGAAQIQMEQIAQQSVESADKEQFEEAPDFELQAEITRYEDEAVDRNAEEAVQCQGRSKRKVRTVQSIHLILRECTIEHEVVEYDEEHAQNAQEFQT